MQTVSSRIWNQVSVSISYDVNDKDHEHLRVKVCNYVQTNEDY